MSLSQWRERDDLVASARNLANNEIFRLMIEVLLNESPVNYQNPRLTAERTLGHIEGYNMCLNNLAALSVEPGASITLEADFAEGNNATPK